MTELPVMAITGTSKGIGRGLAEHFATHGYQVVGCSRSSPTIEALSYRHTLVDVREEREVRSWIRSIKREFDRLDVLVCNAALVPSPMLLTLTEGVMIEEVFRTNFNGTFFACREAAKLMIKQKAGRIITISTMAVGLHEEGTSVYSASKSAVVEMTRILAKELAPFGVTCNTIAPSILHTEVVDKLGEKVKTRALDKLTIQRELTIEEICHTINFFAAPAGGCITGQVLYLGLVA